MFYIVFLSRNPVVRFSNPTQGLEGPKGPSMGARQVQISIRGLTGPSAVKVGVFTVAFRKVSGVKYPAVKPGGSVSLGLWDNWNTPLANGL
jgi:hypothetical protein